MKYPPESEFVAFIGIDWADSKHDVCLQPASASTEPVNSFETLAIG